jgi:hypothetical protein
MPRNPKIMRAKAVPLTGSPVRELIDSVSQRERESSIKNRPRKKAEPAAATRAPNLS